MDNLMKLGRFFFAIPMVAFGTQYLIYGRFMGGLPPVPPWAPEGAVGAYLVGAALIAAGASIAANWKARFSAAALGIFFLFCVLVLHGPKFGAIVHDGVERTRAFEPLAIAGAAFVLAGALPMERPDLRRWNKVVDVLSKTGGCIFGFAMIVFGVQHFMYAPFLATLVPVWIPGHLFWIYFTGVGFIATGLSIIVGKMVRLTATMLGIMFLSWVVVLHGPRVATRLHNGDEWSSLFVAMAMCGGSWVIAEVRGGRKSA